ncbi:transglutaminase family protein [Phaeobacter sp. HF9A]|uniref:transglutaminase family protein n=1 Tax=Phaeobacter sp. HF9A TaxID=2721561 RepID=UPI001430DE44|nr:transglutaminase family protein [Phaeobacter sp. HF9A]NIZ14623.1 transglutaminase family protein [Phaeobacter sp. HF9A]
MRLKIHHVTRYRFETPVTFALQQIRKTPKGTAAQTVRDWSTRVVGGRKELSFEDHHNNVLELISYERNATEVEIISEGTVDLIETHGVIGRHRGPAPLWLYETTTPRTEARSGVRKLLRGIDESQPLEALHALSERIRNEIAYEIGASDAGWSAEDAIEAGRGVCQDHAHVFIACARKLGIPARYVSGYLMLDMQTAQDAMHAWAEAHVEGLGWVGFDISNGISPDTRYVRVATGLDYSDAAPVSGTRIGGGDERLEVQIDVAQQ